jgi:acetaldehyde dehydrogenase
MGKLRCAIVGTGNIGTDLMLKLQRSQLLELALVVGIDPQSEGLALARRLGYETTVEGIEGFRALGEGIELVFEATSARVHAAHAPVYREMGVMAIDLTPAALGPIVIPYVNIGDVLSEPNLNLGTCGAQATVPIVAAIASVAPVPYAEIVSTIASKSAGPGTRQNIDEFTFTTARGLEAIGGAKRGKAIIILNPAEPPIIMTNTVRAIPLEEGFDREAVVASVRAMEQEVQAYVPGYRLKADPVFERLPTPWGERTVVSMLLEVEGAGDYLPKYAGNLDIMTASARRVGEVFAQHLLGKRAEEVRA